MRLRGIFRRYRKQEWHGWLLVVLGFPIVIAVLHYGAPRIPETPVQRVNHLVRGGRP